MGGLDVDCPPVPARRPSPRPVCAPAPVRIMRTKEWHNHARKAPKVGEGEGEGEGGPQIQPSRTPQPFVQKERVLNDEKSLRRRTKQMPTLSILNEHITYT